MKHLLIKAFALLLLALAPPCALAQLPLRHIAPADTLGSYLIPLFREIDIDDNGVKGTLTIPLDSRLRHPAVLLIGGNATGRRDRDEREGNVRPFKQLAEALASNGFAVLRFEPTPQEPGVRPMLRTVADDAGKALKELLRRDEILPRNIILIGHETGAYTALEIASKNPRGIRAVIALAPPALPGKKVLAGSDELIFEFSGGMNTKRRHTAVEALYEAVASGDKGKIRRALTENADAFSASADIMEDSMEVLSRPSVIEFAATDFAAPLKDVRCPVLAIAGDCDLRIPPQPNIEAINRALPEAKTVIAPDTDHLMQAVATPGHPAAPGFSPAALHCILTFLRGER